MKPNQDQIPYVFENDFVLQQLKSSCILSYAEFMRSGYSVHIDMNSLDNEFQPYFNQFAQEFQNKKSFYNLLATSLGLLPGDFKFGQNIIFCRQKKSYPLTCLSQPQSDSIPNLIEKMQNFLVMANKWQRLATGFMRLIRMFLFCSERSNNKKKSNHVQLNIFLI